MIPVFFRDYDVKLALMQLILLAIIDLMFINIIRVLCVNKFNI